MHLKRRNFLLILTISGLFFIFLIAHRNLPSESVPTHNLKNLGKSQYKIVPKCFDKPVVWLVTSYAGNSVKRSELRRVYSRQELNRLGVQRFFLLGEFPEDQQFRQRNVEIESSIYHDIIQGNFTEAYTNLTYKHLMGLDWVSRNCNPKSYVIKMDDDIVINLYDLMPKLFRKEEFFIIGYVLSKMSPMRNTTNKWYITKEEFPGDVFPDFVSGWLYMTNVKTAKKLVGQSYKHEHLFWIDDVFVTGVLRAELGIQLFDQHEHYATDYRYLECCIKGMIKNKKCEFFAGPDGAQKQLLGHFQRYAKFCSDNSCARWDVGKRCVVVFGDSKILGPGQASVQILQT